MNEKIYKLLCSRCCLSVVFKVFNQNELFLCKMNALKKLEELKPNKPYHGFAKLSVGFHQIERFRIVKNKFFKKGDDSNKSILVELKDEVLFLPQYFWQKLNDEDICELNSSININDNVYLYFGGKDEKSE